METRGLVILKNKYGGIRILKGVLIIFMPLFYDKLSKILVNLFIHYFV